FQLQTHYTTSLEDWMASMGDLSRKLIKEHQDAYKPNDSNEMVKNNVGLRNHDVRWKDDVECEENELRVSEMDDNNQYVSVLDKYCKENMEASSEIQVNSKGIH
nr:hypothetical protein [Tanacetum cinerariifolium]